jgi:MYXO-CTERM domain-containing protein
MRFACRLGGAALGLLVGTLAAAPARADVDACSLDCGGLVDMVPRGGGPVPTDGRMLLLFDGGGPEGCDADRVAATHLLDTNGAAVPFTTTWLTVDGWSALAVQPSQSLQPNARYSIELDSSTPAILRAQSIPFITDVGPAAPPEIPRGAVLVGECLWGGFDGSGLGLELETASYEPLNVVLQVQAGDTTFLGGFVTNNDASTCTPANPLLTQGTEFCAEVAAVSPTGAVSPAQSLCTQLPTCQSSGLSTSPPPFGGENAEACAVGAGPGGRPGLPSLGLLLVAIALLIRRRRLATVFPKRVRNIQRTYIAHKETQRITIR